MKFFYWVFGKGRNKSSPTADVPEEFVVDPRKFKPVPKWTHAGKRGKDVYCPKCSGKTHVSHFGWTTLFCGNCRADVSKYDWLMPSEEE